MRVVPPDPPRPSDRDAMAAGRGLAARALVAWAMALLLSPATVGSLLRQRETRDGALDALESQAGAHHSSLAVSAASALTDLLSEPAATIGRITFRRAGLLRGRLAAEAAEPFKLWVPPFDAYRSEGGLVDKILSKAPSELEKDDAVDLACLAAMDGPACRYGWTACYSEPNTPDEANQIFLNYLNILKSCPKADDATVQRLAELLLELLSEPNTLSDDLMRGGAWSQLTNCTHHRWGLSNHLVRLNGFGLVAAELRRVGGSSGVDWLFAPRCRSGIGNRALLCMINFLKARAGEAERPDVKTWARSGAFELCLAAVETFAGGCSIETIDGGSLICCIAALRQYKHLDAAHRAQVRATGMISC